jgi:H/ACA ribonucleoprotein complex non-core subunit NAF1
LRQETRPDGGLNYDDVKEDDDDGPYKPLTRPSNYGEGPSTVETYEPTPRGGAFRGRRGDGRGRGGRGGRGSGRGGRGGHNGPPRDGYSLPPQAPQQPTQSWTPPAPPGWPGAAQQSGSPNFNFQIPGWPQPAQNGATGLPPPPPPPPPGWTGGNAGQPPAPGAFNPAFFAALMGQMQQAQQNGQPQWPGQQQPPPGSGGR